MLKRPWIFFAHLLNYRILYFKDIDFDFNASMPSYNKGIYLFLVLSTIEL
jgi:hypothetical protein